MRAPNPPFKFDRADASEGLSLIPTIIDPGRAFRIFSYLTYLSVLRRNSTHVSHAIHHRPGGTGSTR